jgi:hypothetical protein
MGNKKRAEVLDTIVDCLIINNSITKRDLVRETGLSYVTVKKWIDLIQKIQGLPELRVDGKTVYFAMISAEDSMIENAIAFLGHTLMDEEGVITSSAGMIENQDD